MMSNDFQGKYQRVSVHRLYNISNE